MSLRKTLALGLFVLPALALTTFAGTARADYMGQSFDQSFGSGSVEAGFSGSAGLTYCDDQQLAEAGTRLSCLLKFTDPFTGSTKCLMWKVAHPECMVDASQAYAQAEATGSGWVDLFGNKKSITATARATTADGASALRFTVNAFGTTLIDESRSQIPVGVGASFGEDRSYSIASVSVKVKGEVGAWIGAYLGGGAITNGVRLTATPTINAGVEASASVGALCASASIEGNLDALELSLPTNLDVAYSGGLLTYGIDSDFDYSVLSGKIKAKACVCGACESTTIASYNGWSGGFGILNAGGTLSL